MHGRTYVFSIFLENVQSTLFIKELHNMQASHDLYMQELATYNYQYKKEDRGNIKLGVAPTEK